MGSRSNRRSWIVPQLAQIRVGGQVTDFLASVAAIDSQRAAMDIHTPFNSQSAPESSTGAA